MTEFEMTQLTKKETDKIWKEKILPHLKAEQEKDPIGLKPTKNKEIIKYRALIDQLHQINAEILFNQRFDPSMEKIIKRNERRIKYLRQNIEIEMKYNDMSFWQKYKSSTISILLPLIPFILTLFYFRNFYVEIWVIYFAFLLLRFAWQVKDAEIWK